MKTFAKIILVFIFNLLCYIPFLYSQAPSIQWQKTFGGTQFDQVESVIQTFDGGFAAAGIATSTNGNVTGNHGFGDFWIIKMNAAGTLLWQKSYGGSADEGAFSIAQTADSGFVVAGSSTSVNGNVTLNHGLNDYWIIKLNSAGVLQWQKTLGGSSVDIPYDVHQTSDLGFIIAGYTISNDNDVTGNHGYEDYWIVKLNNSGTLQWQKTFGGSMDERAQSIQQTSDGGYIAGGYTRSTDGDVTGNHGDYDYWVIKLSSSGTLQWQKTFGGTSMDQNKTVQQTTDGGYITAGFTASVNGDVTFNHGSEDLWIVKLSNTGTLQWQKSLGGSGVDQAYQIKQLGNGGYVIGGSSYSLNGDVTGNHGGYDDWVVRTDNVGNIVWQKSLGGSSVEEAYSISPTTNNGYIVAGGSLSNDGDVSGNHGDFDYWIIKLNETSNPLPVELLSFEGINLGKKNELRWSTASEINNDYFEIQRSRDGDIFEELGRINGAGNSSTHINYSFIDKNPLAGKNYYRLKQVDFNGIFDYSEIISVNTLKQSGVSIYPTPAKDYLFVNLSALQNPSLKIIVSDLTGRKLFEQITGDKDLKLNLENFSEGIYLLTVKDTDEVLFSQKILLTDR